MQGPLHQLRHQSATEGSRLLQVCYILAITSISDALRVHVDGCFHEVNNSQMSIYSCNPALPAKCQSSQSQQTETVHAFYASAQIAYCALPHKVMDLSAWIGNGGLA